MAAPLWAGAGRAAAIDTNSDLAIDWNHEVRLSTTYAVGRQSGGAPDYNLGGAGFDSGRLTWLSDFNVDLDDIGLRVSAVGWRDAVSFNRPQKSPWAIVAREPNDAIYYEARLSTRKQGDISLLDAFVHGTTMLGDDQPLSFRLGRHVLTWGESRYFPTNGIAGGQAPLDTSRVMQTATYGDSEIFAPVGQASFSWQPLSGLALAGYYQFEYRSDLTGGASGKYDGAYAYGQDGELGPAFQQLAGHALYYNGTAVSLIRAPDRTPGASGQFGLALKLRQGDFDYGLYGMRFNAKTPELYFSLPGESGTGTYGLLYPKDIQLFGASIAGPIGDASFGAEISARRGSPLVTAGILVPTGQASQLDRLYPTGDTLHAQFSWSYETPPLPGVPDGASWSGEIAGNALLSTTANAGQATPGRSRVAAAFRTIFEPRFLRVFPRVDITTPISVGYNFAGRSAVNPMMNEGAGDFNVGVTATVDQVWRGAFTFAHTFGQPVTATAQYYTLDPGRVLSGYGDFLSITIQRKF